MTGNSKVLSASAAAERREVFFNLRREFPKLMAIVRSGLCSGNRRNLSLANNVCPSRRIDNGSHLVAVSKAVISVFLKPPATSRIVASCILFSFDRVVSLASVSTGFSLLPCVYYALSEVYKFVSRRSKTSKTYLVLIEEFTFFQGVVKPSINHSLHGFAYHTRQGDWPIARNLLQRFLLLMGRDDQCRSLVDRQRSVLPCAVIQSEKFLHRYWPQVG